MEPPVGVLDYDRGWRNRFELSANLEASHSLTSSLPAKIIITIEKVEKLGLRKKGARRVLCVHVFLFNVKENS